MLQETDTVKFINKKNNAANISTHLPKLEQRNLGTHTPNTLEPEDLS
jgi:hypothetical protein